MEAMIFFNLIESLNRFQRCCKSDGLAQRRHVFSLIINDDNDALVDADSLGSLMSLDHKYPQMRTQIGVRFMRNA